LCDISFGKGAGNDAPNRHAQTERFLTVADRILILENGRIVRSGDPLEVLVSQPKIDTADPFLQAVNLALDSDLGSSREAGSTSACGD